LKKNIFVKINRLEIFIIFLFFLSAIFFILFPQIDINFSSLFYKEGVGFYLKNEIFAKIIYKFTIISIEIFAMALMIFLILEIAFKKDFFNIKKRAIIFLLLSLFLGPGILVNTIFKNSWGRARPAQIKEFGGDKKFTPAFIKTDQCEKNCSFPSGHAAAAFYFLSLAFLFKNKKTKNAIIAAALFWGVLVGFVRIIQGGHFLSDVIFSAFFVYFAAKFSYYLVFKRGNK